MPWPLGENLGTNNLGGLQHAQRACPAFQFGLASQPHFRGFRGSLYPSSNWADPVQNMLAPTPNAQLCCLSCVEAATAVASKILVMQSSPCRRLLPSPPVMKTVFFVLWPAAKQHELPHAQSCASCGAALGVGGTYIVET